MTLRRDSLGCLSPGFVGLWGHDFRSGSKKVLAENWVFVYGARLTYAGVHGTAYGWGKRLENRGVSLGNTRFGLESVGGLGASGEGYGSSLGLDGSGSSQVNRVGLGGLGEHGTGMKGRRGSSSLRHSLDSNRNRGNGAGPCLWERQILGMVPLLLKFLMTIDTQVIRSSNVANHIGRRGRTQPLLLRLLQQI